MNPFLLVMKAGWLLPMGAATLAALDIDGYLLSNNFLSILANAISAILLALLNLVTFGTAAT